MCRLINILFITLLISCELTEPGLLETDIIVQETAPQSSVCININEVPQKMPDTLILILFDGGYRIDLIDWSLDSVQVESILIYPPLVMTGIIMLDNTMDSRPIKGILRTPIDSLNGTSFSFLNHDDSWGILEIDSILNDFLYGNFLYEIHHSLEDRTFNVTGDIILPMN